MAIRIPPKFGFKVAQEDKPRLSVLERLKAWSKELEDDRTQIKPHLGDLFGYYGHTSLIFFPDSELGRFGVWQYCKNENHFDPYLLEKYDKIGQILTRI